MKSNFKLDRLIVSFEFGLLVTNKSWYFLFSKTNGRGRCFVVPVVVTVSMGGPETAVPAQPAKDNLMKKKLKDINVTIES